MNDDAHAQGERLRGLLRTYPGGGRELAKMVGVSESQMSRWRQGRAAITWPRAVQLANALGVTPGELYAGEDGWEPPHARRSGSSRKPEGAFSSPRTEPSRPTLGELARQVEDLTQRLEHVEAALGAAGGPESATESRLSGKRREDG